jgi:mannosyltransferase
VSVGTLTREARRPRPGASARVFPLDLETVGLVLLIVLAAALRFWRLRHQGFWFDEANTSQEVHDTPGQMLTLLKHYESTPPFYYGVAWVWARIFGFGEAGLRSLSAVCGVLVVPLGYALSRRLFPGRRAALVAAALVATNPLLIWYSQEARAYEMAVLLAGVSMLAFVYADEEPSPLALAAWAIASALAMATEYYTALLIAPEALWLLYRYRRERPLQVAIGALVLWCVPLLWFAISQNGTGHASWIKHLPLAPRIDQIFPQFLIGFGAPAGTALSWIAGVVALIGLTLLALHVRGAAEIAERRGALLAGGILAAAVLLNAAMLVVGLDNLLTRNVLALWLPAALLVAGGLGPRRVGARSVGVVGLVLGAVLSASGAAAAIGVSLNRTYQRPDWRGVVRVLGVRPAPSVAQRALLIQDYRDVLPLSLYMPRLRAWHHTGTDKFSHYTRSYAISEFDVIAVSSPPAPSTGCWWGSACNLIGTPLQPTYSIPGFHTIWIRHSHQFTILHMVASHPVTVSPQMISGALVVTKLKYDDVLVQGAS